MEVEAISRAFRSEARPVLIGGLKPSLGHSEGASGISSLMKVVLSLEHGMIPATIGVSEINPSIEHKKWKVEIATANTVWPSNAPLRASLNSFGFGGANSHAILEAASTISKSTPIINGTNCHLAAVTRASADGTSAHQLKAHTVPNLLNGHNQSEATESQGIETKRLPVLLMLSAKSPISLERNAAALSSWVASHAATVDLADLEYTLNHRRSLFPYRAYALQSKEALADGLNFIQASDPVISSDIVKPLNFIFTGQGAQWCGMAKTLMQYTVFSNCIRRLDHCLHQLPEDLACAWSLEALILATDEVYSFDAADISQPLCTAIQIAIVDLLLEWNITPKSVVGHSSGEIAAAYAAEFLTAEQAMLSAYVRGYVTTRISRSGAMAAVGLSDAETESLIREFDMEHSVAVACINSPESTTISGDAPAIDTIVERLKDRSIFARTLKTGGRAYHSFHMKEVGRLYEDLLNRTWSSPKVSKKTTGPSARPSMISSVTGNIITEAEAFATSYWRSNLESPVQFRAAVTTMIADHSATTFVEIGPHATLELPIQQIAAAVSLSSENYLYQSALFRRKDAVRTILSLCGTLFQHGFDNISYTKLSTSTETPHKAPRLIHDLPPYAWDYNDTIKNIEPRLVREFRNRRYPRHDLLGSQIPGGSRPTIAWRNILDVHEVPWLKDHCLGPSIVFPAAGYIAIAIEAICQASNISLQECPGVDLRRLNFLKALDLHADQKPRIEVVTELHPKQMTATSLSDRWWELSIATLQDGTTQETIHMTAVIALIDSPTILPRTIQLPRSNMEYQRPDIWYEKFTKEGLRWGPQFAVMDAVYTDRARQNYEAAAGTSLQRGSQSPLSGEYQYIAHPTSIDGMLQTAFVATTAGWVRELRATVPVSMERVQISAPALFEKNETSYLYDTRSEKTGFGTVNIDAELYDNSDRVLVRMSAVRCIPYQGKAQDVSDDLLRKPLARVVWKPDITKAFADTGTGLEDYVAWFAKDLVRQQISIDPIHDRLAACLDLIVHKQPRMSVVYVGTNTAFASLCEKVLHMQSPLRRCSSFTAFGLDDDGQFTPLREVEDGSDGTGWTADQVFDVVIVDPVSNLLITFTHC
jgi:acyl transferase domain-containing protein